MDAVSYINKTYTILSDISPKNYAKLARNNIDGKLYVLKYLKAYDIEIYKTLSKVNIPGISKIYEVIDSPNGLYIVEEYVEGSTLEQKFTSMSDTENKGLKLFEYISQLLETLEALHRINPPIIHRDIKPENIMIDQNDRSKLIDFNISRIYTGTATKDTVAMGTNEFAAPEQYGFYESDPRTDIYGVGATAKYMMKKYGIDYMPMVHFVEKATAFKPEERFSSAEEALFFLKNYNKIIAEKERKEREQIIAASWRRYLPPGFRSGTASHIIIASFAYFMMFVYTYYSIENVINAEPPKRGQYILVIILSWSWFILLTGFNFNYLGVQKIFKIDELENEKKKRAIILVDILIIVITVFIGAFLVNKV